MNQLQKDVMKYVRLDRKTRGKLLDRDEFNTKYGANLPESATAYNAFKSSHVRAKQHGVPITGRLYNLFAALSKETSPVVSPVASMDVLPSFAPASHRSMSSFTLEHYKAGLEAWKKEHPSSKLNSETQIVYFVPNEPITNYEHYATKLTKNTGAILETGGMFKMRSGMKKEILGVDKDVAHEIVSQVKNGTSGPFFLPMACVTGAAECKCN